MSKLKGKVKPTPTPGFPTSLEVIDVKCPCCGRQDVARLLTVTISNVAGTGRAEREGSPVAKIDTGRGVLGVWLQMPAGWAHSLPINWYETRGLASGLARCPDCMPKPNTPAVPQ